MANSGPRTNTSQFFITFRPTAHLDGKHTVFGKLVGGEKVLNTIEKVLVRPGSDRPVKDIIITSVQVLTDPFEAYQERLKARIAKQDQSDEALQRRAEAQKEREKDRTTWLGTNLGERGESVIAKEERKRKAEDYVGVGKYVKATTNGAARAEVQNGAAGGDVVQQQVEFGLEKKKKKAGGFGDFSGW